MSYASQSLISQPGTALWQGVSRSFSHAAALLSRAGMALWHALEDAGQDRARTELRLQAARWAGANPRLAQQLLEASRYDATSRGRRTAARWTK